MTFADRLAGLGACRSAVRWVRKHRYGLKAAWAHCRDDDWMRWLAFKMCGAPGWPSITKCISAGAAATAAWQKKHDATRDFRAALAATCPVWRKRYKLGPVEEIGR